MSMMLPPPTAPMLVARALVAAKYTCEGELTLRHWRGGWWEWQTSHWVEIAPAAMIATAYRFTVEAFYMSGEDVTPWMPNRRKVGDLLHALAAEVHLADTVSQPSWLDGRTTTGPLVSCENGLLDVLRRELAPHSPVFFNSCSVPFAYDPAAASPARWEAFLAALWPDDPAQIAALQQWFGYVAGGRLDQHKILLLVGPTRAGKGVIARTLSTLVGTENVAGPTLSGLTNDFGLAPLIGKSLAVVSDARLNGHGKEAHIIVERLLSVSGEDTLTVNRKNRDQWTGKLGVRFMLCSNELPQLGDASAAIAGRFVTLLLSRSWLGHEDRGLELTLQAELTGILNWALDGLADLTTAGHFTRPKSTDEAMVTLQDLASPVAAFVRDRCTLGPDQRVAVDDLYACWRQWTEDNGHTLTNKTVFGRDLRAAVPGVGITRPGSGAARDRMYAGVALKAQP